MPDPAHSAANVPVETVVSALIELVFPLSEPPNDPLYLPATEKEAFPSAATPPVADFKLIVVAEQPGSKTS